MTATPSTSLRGSRVHTISWGHFAAIGQNTTVEAIGQGDVGKPMRCPGRFVGMFCSVESNAGTAGQTITITAYKGSVAAGNRVYETVFTQTGAADGFASDNTTPAVSEANCIFAAGDDLIVQLVTSATTGNIGEVFIALDFESAI